MLRLKIYTLFLIFCAPIFCAGQAPDWEANPNEFTYQMTIYGLPIGACLSAPSTADIVGFFGDDGVCRGVSNLIEVNGNLITLAIVGSNISSGEPITYRIYDATANTIYSNTGYFTFHATGTCGSFANPLPLFCEEMPLLASSETDDAACAGEVVTFTVLGGTNYKFLLNGNTVQDGMGTTYTTDTLVDQDTVQVIITGVSPCPILSKKIVSTIHPLPIVNLVSSESDDTICHGDEVVFTASGGTNYEFFLNDVSIQNSALATYTTDSLVNQDSVGVQVTTMYGCIDSSSFEIITTVNPLPIVTLTSSETDDTICIGDAVSFTGTGGENYAFYVNEEIAQDGIETTYHTDTLVDGDIVKLVVTDINGCINEAPNTITTTVHPLPIVTLVSSDLDDTICATDLVTFTATGGVDYTFYINEEVAQVGMLANYATYTLQDQEKVHVVVTDINGCINHSPDTIQTTVKPLPEISLTLSDADTAICPETEITFTAIGGINYDFLVNEASAQNSTNPIFIKNDFANQDELVVEVLGANGCSTTSDPIVVTVNPLPIINFTSSDSDNWICEGDRVIFRATGGANYNFILNQESIQQNHSPTYISSNIQHGDQLKVIVTTQHGCVDSSEWITTQVSTRPIGGTLHGSATVCADINLVNLQLEGQQGNITKWQFDEASTFSNPIDMDHYSTFYPAMDLASSRYFRVVFKNGACPEIYSSMAAIEVDQTDLNNDDIPDCMGHCPEDLSVMNLGALPIASGVYQAVFMLTSDGEVKTGNQVTFKAAQSIQLFDGFHAEAGSDFLASIEPCVLEENLTTNAEQSANFRIDNASIARQDFIFNVFPNPILAQAKIQIQLPQAEAVSLDLFDSMGRKMASPLSKQFLEKGSHFLNIPMDALDKGFYFIRLSSVERQVVKKIIVLTPNP